MTCCCRDDQHQIAQSDNILHCSDSRWRHLKRGFGVSVRRPLARFLPHIEGPEERLAFPVATGGYS
ncbi:hypothetical protein EYF80_038024 [Liparis tanakae]|uniref:Uncharacterized protein n=1 Tax=Liparis tanakae TaxID=230148 RepID=A0A4Z2GDY9_9TELE|nr:hypothetical protein EYF80_038024 [Liparis tanakae]